MKNLNQKAKVVTLTAPYDRLSGQGALVGNIFGVAVSDVLSGASGQFLRKGAVTLDATSAQAWTAGDLIYWDDTNKRCDNTVVGKLIGAALEAKANPGATGNVLLFGSTAPQSAAIAALVDNSGGAAANGTIEAVTDVATAANAIKELATKVNEFQSKLKAAGLTL